MQKAREFVELAFKAITVAMGVAVTTLSILGEMEVKNMILLLGIGVASAGISTLMKSNK